MIFKMSRNTTFANLRNNIGMTVPPLKKGRGFEGTQGFYPVRAFGDGGYSLSTNGCEKANSPFFPLFQRGRVYAQ